MNEPILLDKTGAEIIAFVTQRTLAKINEMNMEGLLKIGWFLKDDHGKIYLNPMVADIYSKTSTGAWAAMQFDGSSPALKRIRDDILNTKTEVTAVKTAVEAIEASNALLVLCIDGNRLKTIETP